MTYSVLTSVTELPVVRGIAVLLVVAILLHKNAIFCCYFIYNLFYSGFAAVPSHYLQFVGRMPLEKCP